MTPGVRGWVVLALLAACALAGWSAGGVHAGAKWDQWNYAHVAWDGKASKESRK